MPRTHPHASIDAKLKFHEAVMAQWKAAHQFDDQHAAIIDQWAQASPDARRAIDDACEAIRSADADKLLRSPATACRAMRKEFGGWCSTQGIELPGAIVVRSRLGVSRGDLAPTAGGHLVQVVAETVIS